MERTFVMLKPDAVRRALIGQIISRFENRGFKILAMKMVTPSLSLAKSHYSVHEGKPFYNGLIEFITSGPVVAMIIEADDAVALVRQMMGSLKPSQAEPGTIRGDLTVNCQQNLIHGADSIESAEFEISIWFPELIQN
ncbi:MAG: nucleoside-diphosphate kinase [Syntrophomonadaceae bacterium]|nr:nucleoside-diphosphate kinase [Syntrophomonadaceae bacterium]